jgi:hypothetical protein
MKKPVEREGALGSSQPLRTVPPQLTKGKREDLIVIGSGFQKDTKATIGGTARTFTMLNDTQGRVAILDDDVKNTGTLHLVVTNSNSTAFKATIDVVEPGAPVPPAA